MNIFLFPYNYNTRTNAEYCKKNSQKDACCTIFLLIQYLVNYHPGVLAANLLILLVFLS